MALPVFGGLFYLFFKLQSSARNFKKSLTYYTTKSKKVLNQNSAVLDNFEKDFPEYKPQIDYLINTVGFPIYQNSTTKYLATGENQYAAMIEEIKKAERYIFMEFFIIEEGRMWNNMLEILKEKAAQGVDVRVMYDDVGCFLKLPVDYDKTLEKFGIKCAIFNPFHPIWSTVQNNRDHRKIVVIDGVTAFTGGSNLADEYINAVYRFGHWKDAGIMVKGDAAWGFTVMFLQMWDTLRKSDEFYKSFKPVVKYDYTSSPGYVQPYDDSPLDFENVGEHIYLQIINRANKYIYITTPYLIIDENMISALKLAAKSGIDVRIITPSVPDKKIVHMTTQSYYKSLMQAGVKIYEYSPGFIHSKLFVSDDTIATVGTVNLDFRSLYLHFECGTLIYGTESIADMKKDFLDLLVMCHQVTSQDIKKNVFLRLIRLFLKLCAPLM
jgi:Phosphatidylserine/phosphatidylglycerophosphate/cardiolipin synthases and related enzymes